MVFFVHVLILYVPVNNFSVMSGWVFLDCRSSKQRIICLAQGHNAVPLVSSNHHLSMHCFFKIRIITILRGMLSLI